MIHGLPVASYSNAQAGRPAFPSNRSVVQFIRFPGRTRHGLSASSVPGQHPDRVGRFRHRYAIRCRIALISPVRLNHMDSRSPGVHTAPNGQGRVASEAPHPRDPPALALAGAGDLPRRSLGRPPGSRGPRLCPGAAHCAGHRFRTGDREQSVRVCETGVTTGAVIGVSP